MEIYLSLSDQEQQELVQLIDGALRAGGVAVHEAMHRWLVKLGEAQRKSQASAQMELVRNHAQQLVREAAEQESSAGQAGQKATG